MLTATGLIAGYHRGHRVLDGVSCTLTPGHTLGVQGPSGCGKSTLIRVLALLHKPDSGRIDVDGTRVDRYRYAAPAPLRRQIGVVFQHPRAAADPRHTLRRVISSNLPAKTPAEETDRLAELVGLTPDLLHRRPHEVSDGQLQRACLARTLATDPRYLLCDEMTAMLDASSGAALVQLVCEQVRRGERGVLMVSHDPDLLAACCDRTVHWDDLVR